MLVFAASVPTLLVVLFTSITLPAFMPSVAATIFAVAFSVIPPPVVRYTVPAPTLMSLSIVSNPPAVCVLISMLPLPAPVLRPVVSGKFVEVEAATLPTVRAFAS